MICRLVQIEFILIHLKDIKVKSMTVFFKKPMYGTIWELKNPCILIISFPTKNGTATTSSPQKKTTPRILSSCKAACFVILVWKRICWNEIDQKMKLSATSSCHTSIEDRPVMPYTDHILSSTNQYHFIIYHLIKHI